MDLNTLVLPADRARAARLLFQLPNDSRLHIALNPAAQWGWQESFLNKTNYLLETLVWQNGNMGKRKSQMSKRPVLYVPPFMRIDNESEKHTVDDIKAILALPRGDA